MEFLLNPEFWVLIAFIVAFAVLFWKASKAATGALDFRAAKIKAAIDESQRLKDEAHAKLAEYQRKQRDALQEAEAIVKQASEEAQRAAARSARDLEAAIERRRRLAVDIIALEETKALAEVRNTAVDVAVAALRRVLATHLDAGRKSALIDEAIAALPPILH